MNAHTPTVQAEGLYLAANNADVLRVVRDGRFAAPLEIGKAAGRPTKNMARLMDSLEREGLVSRDGQEVYVLTDAGRAALAAIDVANGAAPPSATPEGEGGVLWLTRAQVRFNPLNPRKTFRDVPELAETVVAAEGFLQNLTVYPADEEGIHTLHDGERRIRALDLLIADGRWPADRPFRAVEREPSPGQTAFLALIANGAGRHLTNMEEARAFQAVMDEKGLSARAAAQQTGQRDARSVQQMIQVLREAAPADIARHEAWAEAGSIPGGPDTPTWKWLLATVQERREREAQPEQVDLEELTSSPAAAPVVDRATPTATPSSPASPVGAFGGSGSRPPPGPKPATPPDAKLTPVQAMAMFELAFVVDEFGGDAGWVKVRRYWLDSVASDIGMSGLGFVVFSHTVGPDGPHAGLSTAGHDWVRANGGIPINFGALTVKRQQLGVPRDGDGYSTPWLNLEGAAPQLEVTGGGLPDVSPSEIVNALGEDEYEEGDAAAAIDRDEGRDAEALDHLVGVLRDTTEPTWGTDEHWSRKDVLQSAAAAVAAVQAGRPTEAAVALMALLHASRMGHDIAARLVEASRGEALDDEDEDDKPSPVDALRKASRDLQDVLLRHIQPGTAAWNAMEGVYPAFGQALAALDWADRRAAQATEA